MNIFTFRAVLIFTGIILFLGIMGGLVVFWPNIHEFFRDKNKALITPVLSSSRSLALNQWFPKHTNQEFRDAPEITAKAAFFIESKSGEVLFAKNATQKLPIASLVKVMTAVIALEHREMDEQLLVSNHAASMEPDKMWLRGGEKLTLKELLYGLFLVSANDAAETIAQSTTGRREEFLQKMNSKALQLGMKNSFFANPTGLDEDINNSYSSAYDLALLSRYAIRSFPYLVDFSKTKTIHLSGNEDHQDYSLESGINLIGTYPGVIGFKTGFTPEAGLTLITLARLEDKEVIGVILGSSNRREEARQLLDYSFQKLGVKVE